MIWAIVAMLLIIGLVAMFGSYSMVGGAIQILLIIALVVLGIRVIKGRRIL